MGRVEPRRDIHRPCSESASSHVWLLAGALVLLLLLSILYLSYQTRCENHVRAVRVNVQALRRSVKQFWDLNGCQPKSLDEFRRFHRQHKSDIWDEMYVDLTSDKQREVPEYGELNDKGGYFYDPNSGEIRLNLTRPVREYLRWYRGSYEDEIPSHW